MSERTILLAVALGTTLAPLNSTMIAVALPRVLEEFQEGPASSAWLVTAYLVAMAALQPFAGARLDAVFGLVVLAAALSTLTALGLRPRE